MSEDRAQVVNKAAHAAFDVMYAKLDVDDQRKTDVIAQLEYFLNANFLYYLKDREYGRAWMRTGWAGQLLQLYRRVLRLMHMGWWNYPEAWADGPARNNLMDIINHAYFMWRLVDADNREGYE